MCKPRSCFARRFAGESDLFGAEGATTPETLRLQDREMQGPLERRPDGLTEGVKPVQKVKSLRFRDRGGEMVKENL